MDVFVVSPFLQFRSLNVVSGTIVRDLVVQLTLENGIPATDFYLKRNGRVSSEEEPLQPGAVYRLEPRLVGGKGGFGSMLRALGAQIEKTTNREACRDLSGRRLRDVNHEKEMAEWLKKQADREAEKEQRRLDRLQRKLAEPRHLFSDPNYEQQCHDLSERLEDSVLKGMQAASSGLVQAEEGPSRKRPSAPAAASSSSTTQKATKKRCLWTGMEDLVGSDENSDSDSDTDASPSTSSSGSCSSTGPAPAVKPSSSSSLAAAGGRTAQPVPQETPSSSSSSAASSPDRREVKPAPSGELRRGQQAAGETQAVRPAEASSSRGVGAAAERQEKMIPEEERPKPDSSGQAVSGSTTSTALEEMAPVDLCAVESVAELEAMGLERLKRALVDRGMKCGGTIQERAARLFSVRGLTPEQIDPGLLAKPTKAKRK